MDQTYSNNNMPILLLIAQADLYCPPLRFVQMLIDKVDFWLGPRQFGPLQCVERVVRKEDLSYEWGREERASTLETVQDEVSTGDFGVVELFLAKGDDGCDS